MSESEMEGIAERLRSARSFLGVSQGFVAEQVGLHRSALSDIERGMRRVTSDEIVSFSRLYGVPVAELLGEAREEPDGTLLALNRTAGQLTDEDRSELLRFAQFLRSRTGMIETGG